MAGERILVVEDERIVALHVQQILTRFGYAVAGPVGSGEEAIQLSAEARPDVVLMDFRLQGEMSGVQAATQIRARLDVPVIYMTAYAEDEVLRQIQTTEPYGCLIKPVQERELRATIEMTLYKHRLDQKLKESEARYRLLLESSSDSIYVLDRQWRHVVINAAATRFVQMPKDKLLGNKLTDVFPGIEETVFFNVLQRVMETRESDTITAEYTFADGRKGWYEVHVDPTPEGILCVSRDITERKRAEEALQESELKFRSIVEQSSDGIMLVNEQGTVIEYNSALERITGIQREQVVGMAVWNFQSQLLPDERKTPEACERIQSAHLQALHSGQSPLLNQAIEVVFQRADGERRFVSQTLFAIKTGQGFRLGGTARDITERKRAEEALRESEERFRNLFDTAPDSIFIVDRTTDNFIAANPAASQLYGYSNKEFLRMNAGDVSAEPEKTVAAIRDSITQVPLRLHRRKDGAVFPVEITGSYFTQGGRDLHTAFIRDITERKQAEEALRIKDRAIESSINAIALSDLEGSLTYVNPTFLSLWGYSDEQEVLGRSSVEFWEAKEKAAEITEAVRNRGGWIGELAAKKKDGSMFDAQISASMIVDDAGRPAHMVGAFVDITQRKRAEEALRESEQRHRLLFENMLEGAAYCKMLFDDHGRPEDFVYLDVNSAFERLTGLENVAGKKVTEAIPEIKESHPELFEIYGRVALTGHLEKFEINFKPLAAWLSVTVYGMEREYFVAVFDDITERKRAEKEVGKLNQDLERRNRELAALNQASRAMTSTLDLDRVLQLVIGEVRNLLGTEAASVLLRRPSPIGEELVFAASAGPGAERLVGTRMPVTSGIAGWVMQSGQPVLVGDARSDTRFYTETDALTGLTTRRLLAMPLVAKGKTIGVIEAINKASGEFGDRDLETLNSVAGSAAIAIENARLFAAVEQELAERRRAERELERRNRYLMALNTIATAIGQSLDLNYILNTTLGKVLEATQMDGGWVQLLQDANTLTLVAQHGISEPMVKAIRQTRLGQGVAGEIVQTGQPIVVGNAAEDSRLAMWRSTGEAILAFVGVPIKSKDETIGVISVVSRSPHALDPHEAQFFFAIGHQIGAAVENARLARQAAEVEILREVDRLRSELIANVSHELRTPLGLIQISCTSLLMEDVVFDRETRLEFLRSIEDETAKLEEIVGNLLDLGRTDSGRLRLDKQPTDLGQLARNVVQAMQAQSFQHRLVCEVPAGPLMTMVDVRRIEQVLRNLLDNAIKYSPEGGPITVQARWDKGQALILVSDQGIGIPVQERERVFERFYRVENEVTQRMRGAGLGLAVCQGIVTAHGGRIWVEGRPGAGSTFCFTLPDEA